MKTRQVQQLHGNFDLGLKYEHWRDDASEITVIVMCWPLLWRYAEVAFPAHQLWWRQDYTMRSTHHPEAGILNGLGLEME